LNGKLKDNKGEKMLSRFSKLMIHLATGDKGRVCPKCKGTETEDYGSYWHCYRCDYEW